MRAVQRNFAIPALAIVAFAIVVGLLGCSTAPPPPTVIKDLKRPANDAAAVDLQRCQHQLHNTRLLLTESNWIAESHSVGREHFNAMQRSLTQLQQAIASPQPQQAPTESSGTPLANSLYLMHFDFGSSAASLSAEVTAAIKQEALMAPLIVLRGRTDGQVETKSEAAIAKARALAARDLLIAAGVDPRLIRTNYQAIGDHLADNGDAQGRALNRRVEIEIYRNLPRTVHPSSRGQTSSHEAVATQ